MMDDTTIGLRVHQPQSNLFWFNLWLCRDVTLFLDASDPWNILEGQEGLAFKVISLQRVMIEDCHNQTSPGSQALIRGDHAGTPNRRMLEHNRRDAGDLHKAQTYNSNSSSKSGLRSHLLT